MNDIFHTYLTTDCNYMVRSREKAMEFMERQAKRKKVTDTFRLAIYTSKHI